MKKLQLNYSWCAFTYKSEHFGDIFVEVKINNAHKVVDIAFYQGSQRLKEDHLVVKEIFDALEEFNLVMSE